MKDWRGCGSMLWVTLHGPLFYCANKGKCLRRAFFFFQVKIKKGTISLVAMEKADWRVLDL